MKLVSAPVRAIAAVPLFRQVGAMTTVSFGWKTPLPVASREFDMGVTPIATMKVAVTDLAAFMVTWQEPVPEQAPLQPVKVEPAAGAAVRVTTVPAGSSRCRWRRS